VIVVLAQDVDIKINAEHNFKVVTSEKSDYQNMVNIGVANVTTDYFMVLEYDDFLNDNATSTIAKYIESNKDYDVLMSIVKEVKGDEVVAFSNEITWNMGAAENLGELDLDLAKKIIPNLCGTIFKTIPFLEKGGLKDNFEIYADYELILRLLEKGLKFFTIPKTFYFHTNDNVDGFENNLKVNEFEKKQWRNLCLSERYFLQKRDLLVNTQ
jgi:GT2 family glycosyltransferase